MSKSFICSYMITLHVHSLFSKLFIIIISCTTGVPGRPEITGFTKPATEGDVITLTCTTLGSKPAANIRWFRNDKEVQGKHVVCVSQGIVPSITTCILLETSLLSSLSASAFLLCSYSCIVPLAGVYWCHDSSGLLLLLGAVQILLDCAGAVQISLPVQAQDI